jgi:hypothetical protein
MSGCCLPADNEVSLAIADRTEVLIKEKGAVLKRQAMTVVLSVERFFVRE